MKYVFIAPIPMRRAEKMFERGSGAEPGLLSQVFLHDGGRMTNGRLDLALLLVSAVGKMKNRRSLALEVVENRACDTTLHCIRFRGPAAAGRWALSSYEPLLMWSSLRSTLCWPVNDAFRQATQVHRAGGRCWSESTDVVGLLSIAEGVARQPRARQTISQNFIL